MNNSKHYLEDRRDREEVIRQIGYGRIIKTVEVDRGHRNGPEIHKISNTGIITIYNKGTGKMITKLIARPAQIRRYYENEPVPQNLLRLAREHQERGYNER